MKKELKNNKGSTLVLLVMAIAVISLLGTSILGVTMMNLKIKKANTEIKKSFYLSESGLDKAYDKLNGFVLEAIIKGNNAAQTFTEGLNNEFDKLSGFLLVDNTQMYTIEPEYNNCIKFVHDDGTYSLKIDETEIEKKEKFEFEKEYMTYLSESKITNELSGDYGDADLLVAVKDYKLKNDPDPNIKDYIEFNISSNYNLKDDKTGKSIAKKTAVDIRVDLEDYNKSYKVETKSVNVNPFWTKVLTANDLNISGNSGTISIDDEVFVSHNLNISGTVTPEFKNKLAVRNDIVLGTKSPKAELRGNLLSNLVYANNILMEGPTSSFKSTSNDGVYVKDDLEINNSNQTVDIAGSYYGFSDVLNAEGPPNLKHKGSSSIIINDTSSNLKVVGDLYLYGSSYINISDSIKYQTGESISVKGNYKAYAFPLEDGSKNKNGDSIQGDDIHFGQYGDLYLADAFLNVDDSIGNTLSVFDKAEYLLEYVKKNDFVKPNNLNFGNIYTIGTALDNAGKPIIASGDPLTFDNKMKIAGSNHYKEVRKLGYTNALLDEDEKGLDNDKDIDDVGLIFNNQVPFIDVTIAQGTKLPVLNGKAKIYVCNDENNTLELKNETFDGLIVTKGNVNISGSVTFTGSIVCGGKITINADGESKTFKHDKQLIGKIISEQNLNNLFKSDTIKDKMSFTVYKVEDSGDESSLDDRIKLSNWRIE